MYMYTANRESFTGLYFRGFRGLSEKRESFPMNFYFNYKHILVPGLVPQKYYHENPYTVDTPKI